MKTAICLAALIAGIGLWWWFLAAMLGALAPVAAVLLNGVAFFWVATWFRAPGLRGEK